MTTTYLVNSHLGGYYFSSDEIDDIERICETCGDCDRVCCEFDDDDADDAAESILDYFAMENGIVTDESDLFNYGSGGVDGMREAIDETFSDESIMNIVKDLDLDSDDPIAAALFNFNPRSTYKRRLDSILDECGVAFDGKPADVSKQEATVTRYIMAFADDDDDNFVKELCFRLAIRIRMVLRKKVSEKKLGKSDIEDISKAYADCPLHDGVVAVCEKWL